MMEYDKFFQLADVIMYKLFKMDYFSNEIRDEIIKSGLYARNDENFIDDVFQWLRDKGFIVSNHRNVWSSSSIGRDIIRDGGFKKYIEIENERKLKAEIKEEEERKLRLYNIKNAKRIYKTYWRTFGFSVIALIVSLVLLVLKMSGK